MGDSWLRDEGGKIEWRRQVSENYRSPGERGQWLRLGWWLWLRRAVNILRHFSWGNMLDHFIFSRLSLECFSAFLDTNIVPTLQYLIHPLPNLWDWSRYSSFWMWALYYTALLHFLCDLVTLGYMCVLHCEEAVQGQCSQIYSCRSVVFGMSQHK